MRRYTAGGIVTLCAVSMTCELGAQVGYPPNRSPYRDLRQTQEVTLYGGYYRAKLDPGRVAPRSGPIMGARYQWRAGGPAHLTFDLARVGSERHVLDPERQETCPSANRDCKSLGMYRWPLYMADFGMALALTGERSWLNLVPELKTGIGIVSDFHTIADVGDFAFGTRFAFSWGGGMRWTPGGPYQLRVDVVNRLYSVKYPEAYYLPAEDGTTIFSVRQGRTAWLNNPALTIGVSYLFSR